MFALPLLALLIPPSAAGAPGDLALEIVGPGPAPTSQMGYALAATESGLAIGAPGIDGAAGAVYFIDSLSSSAPLEFRAASPEPEDRFGAAIGAAGAVLAIGAPGRRIEQDAAGSVCLFDIAPDSATFGQLLIELQNPDPADGDGFGAAIAGLAGFLYVGAPCDDAGELVAGAVHVFDAVPWREGFGRLVAIIPNPYPAGGDRFGAALAGAGSAMLVGAPGSNVFGGAAGAAYAFEGDGLALGELRGVLANPSPARGDGFGETLAGFGDGALVAAPGDVAGPGGKGTVYLFDCLDGDAHPSGAMRNPNDGNAYFGASLATSGDAIAIGAEGSREGSASILLPNEDDAGFALLQFADPARSRDSQFGFSVALWGGLAWVGAPGAGIVFGFDLGPEPLCSGGCCREIEALCEHACCEGLPDHCRPPRAIEDPAPEPMPHASPTPAPHHTPPDHPPHHALPTPTPHATHPPHHDPPGGGHGHHEPPRHHHPPHHH